MKEYKYTRGALKNVLNVLVHKCVCLIEYIHNVWLEKIHVLMYQDPKKM